MMLALSILFYFFGLLFLLLALWEERDDQPDEEIQLRTDHLIIIFFVISWICFWVGAATLQYVYDAVYDPINTEWVTYYYSEYQPIGWLGAGLGMFVMLLLIIKVISTFYSGPREREINTEEE